jgi:hypothetical protein
MRSSKHKSFLITKKTLLFELVVLFAVFAFVNLASYYYQSPGTFNGGRGTDGVFYDQVAEQFAQGQLPESDAPFVYWFPCFSREIFTSDSS